MKKLEMLWVIQEELEQMKNSDVEKVLAFVREVKEGKVKEQGEEAGDQE